MNQPFALVTSGFCNSFHLVPQQTPSSFKNQSRFDTIFYVGFSDKIPCDKAVKDKSEVSAVIWSDPEDALVQNREEKFWLAPPQFYELSRLLNFTKFDELKRFAATRSLLGTRTWMPYMIDLKDGGISIYPQDDLYPAEPDYFGKDLEQVPVKKINAFTERPIFSVTLT
jgi:nucleoside diphosphate-linked moiety X motif protein 19